MADAELTIEAWGFWIIGGPMDGEIHVGTGDIQEAVRFKPDGVKSWHLYRLEEDLPNDRHVYRHVGIVESV